VKDLFTSKSQMRLEIDELSRKVDLRLYGNVVLAQRHSEILAAVISELRTESMVVVNHGTISIATTISSGGRDATSAVEPPSRLPAVPSSDEEPPALSTGSLFDGVEAAIVNARLTRPSERVR
jgi:hypothetical protein